MSNIKLCLVAPSNIADSGLCFEALTGKIDWVVPSTQIRVKPVPHRSSRPHVKLVSQSLTELMRESVCAQGLYPRASIVLVESLKLYEDVLPSGLQFKVHPFMRFMDTDKSVDYAVIVISVVSFCVGCPPPCTLTNFYHVKSFHL